VSLPRPAPTSGRRARLPARRGVPVAVCAAGAR
jgi:hypothetical protein